MDFRAEMTAMQGALQTACDRIESHSNALPDSLKLASRWEIVTITTLVYMNRSIDMSKVRKMRNNDSLHEVMKGIYDECSIHVDDDDDDCELSRKRRRYFKNTAIVNYSLSDERNRKSIKLFNNTADDIGKIHLTGAHDDKATGRTVRGSAPDAELRSRPPAGAQAPNPSKRRCRTSRRRAVAWTCCTMQRATTSSTPGGWTCSSSTASSSCPSACGLPSCTSC
jgi:hypothetical protein